MSKSITVKKEGYGSVSVESKVDVALDDRETPKAVQYAGERQSKTQQTPSKNPTPVSYPKTSKSRQDFLDRTEKKENGGGAPHYLRGTCASSRMSMANLTPSQLVFQKKQCPQNFEKVAQSTTKIEKKKSKPEVAVEAKESALNITLSQHINLSSLGGIGQNGSSFLARITLVDPNGAGSTTGKPAAPAVTQSSVEKYLSANPDFLASYVCKNIPPAVLRAWACQMSPSTGPNCLGNPNGSSYGGAGGGCGFALQASAPYDSHGQAFGGALPVWPSGIQSQNGRNGRVKKKCNLATLMNYYRQGDELIDWSGGMSNYSGGGGAPPCLQNGGGAGPYLQNGRGAAPCLQNGQPPCLQNGQPQQQQQQLGPYGQGPSGSRPRTPPGNKQRSEVVTPEKPGTRSSSPKPIQITSSTDVIIRNSKV